MALLNAEAYKVTPDNLIYDAKHPIDAENLSVALSGSTAGTLLRGQIIDIASGVYGVHKENGTPSAIVAEDTEYTADDSSVVVTAYVSGAFRTSGIIATPELTVTDIETLRSKGIFLK